MDKWPQPFWAVFLASLGVVVCLCVLFHANSDLTVANGVLQVSSNLVSGALGAFAGAAHAKADVTMGKGPLTINQDKPAE